MTVSSTSSLNRVRFAMIGCGRMGRHHSEMLLEDGRGEVVALLDSSPAMATRLQQEYWPAAAVATHFDDLIANSQVDAAIICTPTAEHYPQARRCLDRGWHVLCEKPLASDRLQILDLIHDAERARARGQAFSLGYQRRYTALFRTLRKQVHSGRWGAVRAIASHNVENWQSTIAGTWRDDPEQNPGGFITDAGSHKLDILFYVTGLNPLEVFTRTQKWGSQVEIVASVSALLTGDVTLTMDFIGNAQYLGEDLHIHCDGADLMVRHEELWIAQAGHRERLPIDESDSNPVTGILNMILDGKPDVSPPEAALPVYDITQAILASGRTGMPVKVHR
ncbi:Gfo/Idh/MocA family protein [Schlesneria sp. DSM 10557]|uniref:Gfo/Idh/MocA family protein n=1 Tax=Schlesneria sp. DSM 10557 TaxID=3044399 RepID=UPI00359F95E9